MTKTTLFLIVSNGILAVAFFVMMFIFLANAFMGFISPKKEVTLAPGEYDETSCICSGVVTDCGCMLTQSSTVLRPGETITVCSIVNGEQKVCETKTCVGDKETTGKNQIIVPDGFDMTGLVARPCADIPKAKPGDVSFVEWVEYMKVGDIAYCMPVYKDPKYDPAFGILYQLN